MNQAVFVILILAVDPVAPIAAGGGPEVFHCAFDAAWDANYDDWPDGWSRRRGKGYPEYIPVRIAVAEDAPDGNRCLQVDLDGGAAVAYSPPIPVCSLFSYVAEASFDTGGLDDRCAYLSLTFLDHERRLLQTHLSGKAFGREGWTALRLGPVEPEHEEARMAVLGLHVEPERRTALGGRVRIDAVSLARLPRVRLAIPGSTHLFADQGELTVECTVSGIGEDGGQVELILEDGLGRPLAAVTRRLATSAPATDRAGEAILVGTAAWRPPVPGPGFYRVRAELPGHDGPLDRNDVTAAVIVPRADREGGEFGWSFSDRPLPLDLFDLSQVIGQAGISWLKFPMWSGASDETQLRELVRFGERLAGQGIQIVGLLGRPPEDVLDHFTGIEPLSAAVVFSAPEQVWYPSVKPILIRMATQVRWWQLGDDKDTGFVNYPGLVEKTLAIKGKLDEVGYGVKVGFGWGWMNELPEADRAPWQFISLSSDPPLTSEELAGYLEAAGRAGVRRWVVLEPLPKGDYRDEVRILDLVRRMIAAKIHGAEGIFLPEPIGERTGVLRDDGTPGELFLPWRTSALMLSSAEYLGQIELPCGSENRIFLKGDEAIMVVWNPSPCEEALYLGEEVRQVDLWGAETVPRTDGHRQIIAAGRFPVFVTGLDPSIVRWRQSFAFEEPQIPSVFGRSCPNAYRITNTFSQPVSVTARLAMPEVWEVSPWQVALRLETGQEHRQPFHVVLPYDATSGPHPVRLDVEVQGQRPLRFSIFRRMHVGLGQIRVEVQTRLAENGDLQVEQQFINDTDEKISFRCYLYVPNRRRQKLDVLDLGHGRDVQRFCLPDGRDLVGQTLWLQAEEIGGYRVINHQFKVEP